MSSTDSLDGVCTKRIDANVVDVRDNMVTKAEFKDLQDKLLHPALEPGNSVVEIEVQIQQLKSLQMAQKKHKRQTKACTKQLDGLEKLVAKLEADSRKLAGKGAGRMKENLQIKVDTAKQAAISAYNVVKPLVAESAEMTTLFGDRQSSLRDRLIALGVALEQDGGIVALIDDGPVAVVTE